MGDICGDNRFELIEKYKQKLLDATNIVDSPEEMAVIDNILFRFWQMGWLRSEPPAQPGQRNARVFQGIIVEYPTNSTYPEYEGKPYFSIKYTENRQEFIGYGTYKPEVLSKFLKEYFMPPTQPGWIPVTERLPDRTDTYLVQVGTNENGEGMHTAVRTAEWNVIWQTWYVHTTHCFVGDIIKWMPIPREGGQDEQN